MDVSSARLCLYLLCVAVLAACVPSSRRQVSLPHALPTAQLFACTEEAITHLRAGNQAWQPVSLRDDGAGVLESGDYPQRNRIGLRIRLQHRSGSDRAQLLLRGAGPYFIDLGVDAAADELAAAIEGCLR